MNLSRLDHKLTVAGAAALSAVIVLLITMFLAKSMDVRRAEIKIKGQQAAASLADAIGHAREVGVPFESMVGLNELVVARQSANRDILNVAAETSRGAVLHKSGQGETGDEKVIAPILANGKDIGKVTVWLRKPAWYDSAASPIIVFLILLLSGCVLLREAAAFSMFRGIETRASAVQRMSRQIRERDFYTVIVPAANHPDDPAASLLANRIRALNEKYLRLTRLVESLRNTEPDPAERSSLANINREAQAGVRFADGKPTPVRLSAVVSDARWILFLSAFVAEGIRSAAPPNVTEATFVPAWGVVAGAFGGMVGIICARALFGRQSPARLVVIGLILMLAGICYAFGTESDLAFLVARWMCGGGLGLVVSGCSQAIDNRKSATHDGLTWFLAIILGGEIAGPVLTALLAGMSGPTGGLAPLFAVTVVATIFFVRIQAADSAWQETPERSDLLSWYAEHDNRSLIAGLAYGVFWGIALSYMVSGNWTVPFLGVGSTTSWAAGWLAFSLGCGAGVWIKDSRRLVLNVALGLIGVCFIAAIPWVGILALPGIFLIGTVCWRVFQKLWNDDSQHPNALNGVIELIGLCAGGVVMALVPMAPGILNTRISMLIAWSMAAASLVMALWFSRHRVVPSAAKM